MRSPKNNQADERLTSVKVNKKLYNSFKISCLQQDFSLKQLVDKAMFLYLNDKDFRQKLNSNNKEN